MESFNIQMFIQGIWENNINLTIGIIDTGIFLISVILYLFAYRFLLTFNRDIPHNEAFREMERQYNEKLKKSTDTINTLSFIESYFSGCSPFKSMKIPLIQILGIVQISSTVFILLGVFGTFLGLTNSLHSLKLTDLTEEGIKQSIGNISQILSGMGTAFYASILGVLFSLAITIITKLFNAEHLLGGIMSRLENYLDNTLRNDSSKDVFKILSFEIASLRAEVRSAIESTAKTVGGSILQLEGSIASSIGLMKDENNSFLKQVEDLNAKNINGMTLAFTDSIGQLLKSNNESLREVGINISGCIDRLGNKNIEYLTHLDNNMNEVLAAMKKDVGEYIADFASKSMHVLDNTYDMTKKMYRAVEEFSNVSEEFKKATGHIREFNEKVESSVEQFGVLFEEFKSFINRFDHLNDSIDEKTNMIKSSIGELSGQINSLSDTYQGMAGDFIKCTNENAKLLESSTGYIVEEVRNLVEGFGSAIGEKFGAMLDGMSQRQQEFLKDIKDEHWDNWQKYGNSLDNIKEVLDSIGKSMTASVAEIKVLFEKEGDYISAISGRYESLAKSQDVIKEEYSLQTNKVSELIKDIGSSITGLKEGIENLKEQQKFNLSLYSDLNSNIGTVFANHEALTGAQLKKIEEIKSSLDSSLENYMKDIAGLTNRLKSLTATEEDIGRLFIHMGKMIETISDKMKEVMEKVVYSTRDLKYIPEMVANINHCIDKLDSNAELADSVKGLDNKIELNLKSLYELMRNFKTSLQQPGGIDDVQEI